MEAGYWSEPSGTATGIEPTTPAAPLSSRLAQNHPNPFNPTTTIEFALSEAGRVEIQLFDAGGRRVRTLLDEHRQAGVHQLVLSANELASGVYWYRLQSGGFRAARRMVLLK
jgi:hypothetical protein